MSQEHGAAAAGRVLNSVPTRVATPGRQYHSPRAQDDAA